MVLENLVDVSAKVIDVDDDDDGRDWIGTCDNGIDRNRLRI